MVIGKAELEWQGNTPRSRQFNDIYYSPDNGLLESQYVFIEQNKLLQRWSLPCAGKSFVIAETGFGTGLNFLVSCLNWQNICENKKNSHLHFISFEKYPLDISELKKAHAHFPETRTLSGKLIDAYPKTVPGLHHLHISDNISLTLFFGEALDGIMSLDENTIKVDAWFFDGFTPKHDEGLWCPELFEASKKLNKTGTTFATFTAAGHVKRKLEAIGFSCEKVKGFGHKREMLRGEFLEHHSDSQHKFPYQDKPWLYFENPGLKNTPKQIAVIGAGLAGMWSAHAIARRGVKVDVFEKHAALATEASGNSRGATYFKLEPDQHGNLNLSAYFYLSAYLYSIRQLNSLFKNNNAIWQQSGLLQLAFNEQKQALSQDPQRFQSYAEIAHWIEKDSAMRLAGCELDMDALYFPDAGHASPALICQELAKSEAITCHTEQEILRLEFDSQNQKWSLYNQNQHAFHFYDAVVIANSIAANGFTQSKHLPLHKVRGQSSQVEASEKSFLLNTVVCSKGYITPAIDGRHTIGSTFDPKASTAVVTEEDNESNLYYLQRHTPAFYHSLDNKNAVDAKAAFRCQTPDSLPMLGQLCDYEDFKHRYEAIAKGQIKRVYPKALAITGLYINSGHASRGIISTPYCAELLAREIFSEATVCEKMIKEALSPSRFYFREIKKGTR